MANITVRYKGLTGKQATVTIDDGETLESLIALIAADEGITETDYYRVSLSRNYSVENVTFGDSTATLASLDIISGDEFLCTPNQSGTKEYRQRQKLDISEAARAADGLRSTYDITELPTRYAGNDVVNNPNVGGLILGRPWS